MKYRSALIAVAFIVSGQSWAASYLVWEPAKPAMSCQIVCDKVNLDPVYNLGAHKSGNPIYVCSTMDGLPGANHTYSVKAAGYCHIQKGGKGSGITDYSCLCVPKQ